MIYIYINDIYIYINDIYIYTEIKTLFCVSMRFGKDQHPQIPAILIYFGPPTVSRIGSKPMRRAYLEYEWFKPRASTIYVRNAVICANLPSMNELNVSIRSLNM